ncbi:hypothetical protein [Photorhabdus laumondii]|uniref:hypothetical protein n=1 Tax=Photorhabdus laumondii TaxID=2218628 RepID=UPI003315A23A
MTGVSECSQQRGNLKDNGYINLSDYCIYYIANGIYYQEGKLSNIYFNKHYLTLPRYIYIF